MLCVERMGGPDDPPRIIPGGVWVSTRDSKSETSRVSHPGHPLGGLKYRKVGVTCSMHIPGPALPGSEGGPGHRGLNKPQGILMPRV